MLSLVASTSRSAGLSTAVAASLPCTCACVCTFSTSVTRSRNGGSAYSYNAREKEERRKVRLRQSGKTFPEDDDTSDQPGPERPHNDKDQTSNYDMSSNGQQQPSWALHRAALKAKFPEGWNPPRKISRGDMHTMRRLHGLDSTQWSTPNLADRFRISPEAVRRVLKSTWKTDMEEEEERVGAELLERASDIWDEDGVPSQQRMVEKDFLSRRRSHAVESVQGQGEDSSHVLRPEPRRRATPLRAGFEPSSRDRWARTV